MSGLQYPQITGSGSASIQAGDRYEFNFTSGCENGQHPKMSNEQIERLTRQIGELQEYLRRLQLQQPEQPEQNTRGALTERSEAQHHDHGSSGCLSSDTKAESSHVVEPSSPPSLNQTSNNPIQRTPVDIQGTEAFVKRQSDSPLQSIPTSLSKKDTLLLPIKFTFTRRQSKLFGSTQYNVRIDDRYGTEFETWNRTLRAICVYHSGGIFPQRTSFAPPYGLMDISSSTKDMSVSILLRSPWVLTEKSESDLSMWHLPAGVMRWLQPTSNPDRVDLKVEWQFQRRVASCRVHIHLERAV